MAHLAKTNTYVKKSFKESMERGRHDPVKFAWDFLGLELHPAQVKFLQESIKPGIKEANLSAGNRFGKGEVAAVKLLWSAFYQVRNPALARNKVTGQLRDYTAINTSISLDQASIVFNKAAGYAQNNPNFSKFVERVINSPFPTMELKKMPGAQRGAEIWARSLSHGAKYLLGQNFQYLNIDEASLEPNGETILNDVIRMRMADSGGNIDTTSQPRGKNWWFYHVMQGFPENGNYDPAVYSQYGSSFDNPYIDHEHVKRSMARMTQGQVLENIWGKFSDDLSFFSADKVAACYKDQDYTLPIKPGYQIDQVIRIHDNHEIVESHHAQIPNRITPKYVMGIDLAAKYDQTCIVVLRIDVNPWQMVYFELFGKTDWRVVKQKVAKVHKMYNSWGYTDSTGPGGPVFEDLIGPDFNCDLAPFNFSGSSGNKLALLTELQMAIEGRDFIFPFFGQADDLDTRALVNQLIGYRLDDKKIATDAVFGLALAIKAAKDALERENRPAVFTPDLSSVIGRRDPRTGIYIFDNADPYDEYDRTLRRYQHLL